MLRSAACVTATVCLAVGTTSTTVSDVVPAKVELLDSGDGGHTWAVDVSPGRRHLRRGVPAALVCAMVGTEWAGQPAVGTGAVAQSANGGTTFRGRRPAYVPLTLTALSCPSATACIAVGGDTVARITVVAPEHRPTAAPFTRAPPGR